MDAIGYVRVSTAAQGESGLGLLSQCRQIEAASILHDYHLVKIIEDVASGGTMKRPGMTEVLELIDQGGVDALVIAKLDRVSRSIGDLDRLIKTLRNAPRADGEKGGVDLVSTSESLDTGSASGRLVLAVLGSVSQWEREVISERTREALARKREKGERIGTPPFGYRAAEDGTLMVHEPEQRVLEELRLLRTTGESWTEATEKINQAGHKTRGGRQFSRQGLQHLAKGAGIR